MSDPQLNYSFLIFDLDGTLVDTLEEIAQAVNLALAEAKLPSITLEQARAWVGRGAPHFLRQVLASYAADTERAAEVDFAALLAAFYRFYAETSGTKSRLFRGVRESLDALQKQGKPMAVLTNKFKLGAERVLKAHDLDAYFVEVLGGDSFAAKKPDPVGIHYLIQKYHLSPEQVLFLGDSAVDIEAARKAGVDVWVFPHGYNQGGSLEALQPDRILQSFTELRP